VSTRIFAEKENTINMHPKKRPITAHFKKSKKICPCHPP
jgi:hypothetical protein